MKISYVKLNILVVSHLSVSHEMYRNVEMRSNFHAYQDFKRCFGIIGSLR